MPVVRRILHCDLDCFYAAVHVRDDPSLAGKPVVIGGRPGGRGVVMAASYEARRFGVRSAMPAARAVRLCPQAVFLPPDFTRYRQDSEAIFALYRELTPLVETVSLDEAYLDVTEHLGRWQSATALAREIRRRVREERRLTVSVGVAPNRLVAKIASDFDKPDGLTVVPPKRVEQFLAPLPVRRLHGVGPATERVLADLGIDTVAALREQPVEALAARFGRFGRTLWRYARGIDERPVQPERQRKSLGKETTFGADLGELDAMERVLDDLASSVAAGLERRELAAGTITLKVRYGDFTTVTRAHSEPLPFTDGAAIAAAAKRLLRATEAPRRPVRLLGITASRFAGGEGEQLALDLPAGIRVGRR